MSVVEAETGTWLWTGDAAFARMQAAIEAAQSSVRLEVYACAACPLAERFRDALAAAARRGVRVQVLLDAFGSLRLSASFWAPLEEAGGHFRWFNPLGLRRGMFRDHRKLLVCDGAVAFVGGYNLLTEAEGDGVLRGWRDVGLALGGPRVGELAASFDTMFERADFEHPPFTRLRRTGLRAALGEPPCTVLLSGPGRGRNAFQRALLADLARARHVRLVAAYFLPTGRLLRALTRVARRGGRVELVLPGQSDVPLMRLAGQAFYERLLRSGVALYEYQPRVLHTKLIVVDDACYVGSSNLDARSLRINYELMVRLTRAEVVAEGARVFEDHRAHSQRVDRADWRQARSFWRKLTERWACLFLGRLDPLLMRVQLRRLRRR